MSLAIETAALMKHFQSVRNEDLPAPLTDEQRRAAIRDEVAHIACYLLALSNALDVDLSEAVTDKLKRNAATYPADKLRGWYEKSVRWPLARAAGCTARPSPSNTRAQERAADQQQHDGAGFGNPLGDPADSPGVRRAPGDVDIVPCAAQVQERLEVVLTWLAVRFSEVPVRVGLGFGALARRRDPFPAAGRLRVTRIARILVATQPDLGVVPPDRHRRVDVRDQPVILRVRSD